MRLQIKNCVTDPRFKALRRAGKPVFKPLICGQVLVPGAVRRVMATDLSQPDVTFLDSLVKSGSCQVSSPGLGFLDNMDVVKEFLGFSDDQEEVLTPEPEAVIEEPVIVEETDVEEELPQEEEEEASEETSALTEEELTAMRNSDLREFILGLDPEASVGNKSKKKLVALALELQNG